MNDYYRSQIMLAELGLLNVSHCVFSQGSLINSELEASIAKPIGYEKWRSKRKETFLAGRLAVRDAQSCLKVSLVTIAKAEDGSPIWPEGYTGSLSHTDSQAVAVLLPKSQSIVKGIGIDIELMASADKLELPEMIGLPTEFHILAEIGIVPPFASLLLFSVKESLYKALYPVVGEFFDFLDAELVAINNDTFTLQIKRNLSDQVPLGLSMQASFILQGDHLMTWAYY